MNQATGEPNRPEIVPGVTGELQLCVSPDDTASAYGNEGVHVLATPRLVHLIESASVRAIYQALSPGESTVGTKVDVSHLAATPVGMTITIRSTVTAVDGRRLTFEAQARDEIDLIATGTHERIIVDLARFLDRVERKRSRSGS